MNNPNSPFEPPAPSNPYAGGPSANPYAAPISDGQGYQPAAYGAMGMEGPPLASLGARFGGSLLDGLIYGVVAVPSLLIFGGIDSMASGDVVQIWTAMGIPVLLVAMVQWYLIATSGQSLAKKALGMKIVKMDGSDVDFVSGVILRSWVLQLAAFVPLAGNVVGLVDAVFIFGDERRCLHDRIAGTQVISV